VFSTISSRKIRTNNIGLYPFMGEKEGLEAVDAADAAFNNGQEYGPP
jgi:glyceraldehyde-3-phosphate dehydrogenase (NADP+)